MEKKKKEEEERLKKFKEKNKPAVKHLSKERANNSKDRKYKDNEIY